MIPRRRRPSVAGFARGYQLKGDAWKGVILVMSRVFKTEKKGIKYIAPFTEFVLADAILNGAKVDQIHSKSPLVDSLASAMERNATTPSLKSAQDVLLLTAAITKLVETASDSNQLKVTLVPLEKIMEKYDAPELLYVSIQKALKDGSRTRREDVTKALQVVSIRLAGNIDWGDSGPEDGSGVPAVSRVGPAGKAKRRGSLAANETAVEIPSRITGMLFLRST